MSWPDGSNVRPLREPEWGHDYVWTKWASDGRRILALDGRDKIVVFNEDGSQVAEAGKGEAPRWLPSSR